jgi:solute carrier family 25 protein 34/35
LQLQGELAKNGGLKVYNNAFDAMIKTWKNEGVRGMQRGLTVAVRTAMLNYKFSFLPD